MTPFRSLLRSLASAAALILVLGAAGCIAAVAFMPAFPGYRDAFFALLVAFCAIELRVQAGGRVARTSLLWFHLATAIPFYIALGVLAFVAAPSWLVVAMAGLGACALVSGSLVFMRKPALA